ncbi:hypothetical protein BH24ACT1_BH24ACT1_07460 [soil metagenome]
MPTTRGNAFSCFYHHFQWFPHWGTLFGSERVSRRR